MCILRRGIRGWIRRLGLRLVDDSHVAELARRENLLILAKRNCSFSQSEYSLILAKRENLLSRAKRKRLRRLVDFSFFIATIFCSLRSDPITYLLSTSRPNSPIAEPKAGGYRVAQRKDRATIRRKVIPQEEIKGSEPQPELQKNELGGTSCRQPCRKGRMGRRRVGTRNPEPDGRRGRDDGGRRGRRRGNWEPARRYAEPG